MLTLTRRYRETVHLSCPDGTMITVHVKELDGRSVRLGIEAPQSVRIRRGELPPDAQDRQREDIR